MCSILLCEKSASYGIVGRTWEKRNYSRYDKKKKRRVEKCIINAHWLACRDCGTLFFKDKKEKQKYSNYQDKRNKQMNKIVEMMLNKRNKHEKTTN